MPYQVPTPGRRPLPTARPPAMAPRPSSFSPGSSFGPPAGTPAPKASGLSFTAPTKPAAMSRYNVFGSDNEFKPGLPVDAQMGRAAVPSNVYHTPSTVADGPGQSAAFDMGAAVRAQEAAVSAAAGRSPIARSSGYDPALNAANDEAQRSLKLQAEARRTPVGGNYQANDNGDALVTRRAMEVQAQAAMAAAGRSPIAGSQEGNYQANDNGPTSVTPPAMGPQNHETPGEKAARENPYNDAARDAARQGAIDDVWAKSGGAEANARAELAGSGMMGSGYEASAMGAIGGARAGALSQAGRDVDNNFRDKGAQYGLDERRLKMDEEYNPFRVQLAQATAKVAAAKANNSPELAKLDLELTRLTNTHNRLLNMKAGLDFDKATDLRPEELAQGQAKTASDQAGAMMDTTKATYADRLINQQLASASEAARAGQLSNALLEQKWPDLIKMTTAEATDAAARAGASQVQLQEVQKAWDQRDWTTGFRIFGGLAKIALAGAAVWGTGGAAAAPAAAVGASGLGDIIGATSA